MTGEPFNSSEPGIEHSWANLSRDWGKLLLLANLFDYSSTCFDILSDTQAFEGSGFEGVR